MQSEKQPRFKRTPRPHRIWTFQQYTAVATRWMTKLKVVTLVHPRTGASMAGFKLHGYVWYVTENRVGDLVAMSSHEDKIVHAEDVELEELDRVIDAQTSINLDNEDYERYKDTRSQMEFEELAERMCEEAANRA